MISSHQRFITLSVMLATIMQALDITIANVALPHMQGSLGAVQDQISWVLTSYVISSAIFMPLTGFISSRFGRKRIFMWAVFGFTISSMMCGAAQSLEQIVAFRLLQGMFGAPLVPLSQAVLLDTYPKEQHGSAMAMWGVGVMVGPILGPSLGGWLTEYYNWRWVFYINLPFGMLAFLGLGAFLSDTEKNKIRRFDFIGFSFLALAIGSLQLMLDRGQLLDWFSSTEIIIEAIIFVLFSYLFIAHIFTFNNPFIEPAIFSDRNFSVSLLFMFVIGVILLATMAILPPFLQNLMNYPVILIGLLLAPRGIGTMLAMIIVGRMAGKIDLRYQIFFGLLLTSLSLWEMTLFNLDITGWDIVRTGVIQGIGLGFLFVPLSTLAFSTLAPHFRNEGTALFNLTRNIGSSIGISVIANQLSHNTQVNHAAFAQYISPYSQALQVAVDNGVYNLSSLKDLVLLNNEVTRQASLLAYLQDFQLMMWLTLSVIPFILLLKRPQPRMIPSDNPTEAASH